MRWRKRGMKGEKCRLEESLMQKHSYFESMYIKMWHLLRTKLQKLL